MSTRISRNRICNKPSSLPRWRHFNHLNSTCSTTLSLPDPPPFLSLCVSLSPPADGGELPPRVEQRNGQLHFTKVTRSDAGNYTCIASNSLQGEIRAVVNLTVAGKPLTHLPGNGELWKEDSRCPISHLSHIQSSCGHCASEGGFHKETVIDYSAFIVCLVAFL